MKIDICFRKEVDSTNDWAKQMAGEGAPEGTLALADSQILGRGRRGRSWKSPAGDNLYMSLILRPEIPPEKASGLTLVMGLSAAQGITDVLELPVKIKWPNDLVIEEKKFCGILTEMNADRQKIRFVVVGIGINVNNSAFSGELQGRATSLKLEKGTVIDKDVILEAVMAAFEKNYKIFLKTQDLSGLVEEYNRILVNRSRPVRVLNPVNAFEGVAQGINTSGELLVERADGSVTAVYAGEVSVRGASSYV
ncbi:biotin--[acetyl-CoA-carboxylase] ligase [Novisyntrophococcus fermenticellae]|uniref:biotin--[acetyl-CoA-carboxylase] ligase n=1 Tax=Novisyntrophococcus fermenticellae TaxID=2068655 RepID=UPI001E3C925C|nr:biotin--[acetyl-CoA-carboxylase] ligase [Novisyntrophococcus fermenticellae]